MAVGLGSKAADEEARAEVEVLNSRLEKTSQLSKKIQASLSRLESNGKSMQDAIGPIYGDTKKLQVLGTSMFCLDDLEGMADLLQILKEFLRRSGRLDSLPTSRAMKKTSYEKGESQIHTFAADDITDQIDPRKLDSQHSSAP